MLDIRENKLRSTATRRQFIKLVGLGGATLVVESCGFLTVDGEIESDEPYNGPADAPDWTITPNDEFFAYTNTGDFPIVDGEAWRLTIDGAVNRSVEVSLADLHEIGAQRRLQTIACGGANQDLPWIGNAMWGGRRLRDLLDIWGVAPLPAAIEMQWTGADDFTNTHRVGDLYDRESWLVWVMNGEPLPRKNGYPARYLVSDLMGVKNMKWPTRLHFGTEHVPDYPELTYPQIDVDGGLIAPRYNPSCFFQLPQPGTEVAEGVVRFSGCAFAGRTPVSKVEVSSDNGSTWNEAVIAYQGPSDVWSLWYFDWSPPGRGSYQLHARVEASDGRATIFEDNDPWVPRGPGHLRITVV